MSREELGSAAEGARVRGARVWGARVWGSQAGGSQAGGSQAGPPGGGTVHDDLDAPPPGGSTGSSHDDAPPEEGAAGAQGERGQQGERGGRRERGRRVAALLLAAAAGAGGALLAVRGSDAGSASLVSVGSYADTTSGVWGADGELTLVVAVANTGESDLLVLGGGTRTADGDLVGELAPTGFAPAADRAGDEGITQLPSRSTNLVELTMSGSCDDPPAWDLWLRVRTPSGSTSEVPVTVLDDPSRPGSTGFEGACAYAAPEPSSPPAVVGQRSSDGGLVLRVVNDTGAPYDVEVVAGGVAGLALVDPDVVLPPSGTSDVAVRIAPTSCESALAASDLVQDVELLATPSEGDGAGAGPVRLSLDPSGAGVLVGVAVGRACAAGA